MIYPQSNPYYRPTQWLKPFGTGAASRRIGVPYQAGSIGRRAIGFIRCVAAASLVDGDNFTIIDAFGRSVTFEYRVDDLGPVSVAGRIAVPVLAADTAAVVAQRTAAAINGLATAPTGLAPAGTKLPGGYFNTGKPAIAALQSAAQTSEIMLVQYAPGAQGNTTIAEAVANAGFVVAGFGGGLGHRSSVGRMPAVGAIVAIASASFVDTEGMTFNDGLGTADSIRRFEFTSDGAVPAGDVAVDITGAVAASVMATRIIAAINSTAAPPVGPGPLFGIQAYNITPTIVGLVHDRPGPQGGGMFIGRSIAETVANAGFMVMGMVGGQLGSAAIPLRRGPPYALQPIELGFGAPLGE